MVNRVHTSGLLTLSGQSELVRAAARDFLGQFTDPKGRPIDVFKAMELQFYSDVGRVGDTYLGPEAYPTHRVSTVWLNEPQMSTRRPQWETLVFSDGELDGLGTRYWTRREAEIGHRKWVRIVKALVCTKAPVVKTHKTRNRQWQSAAG
jgi:hypothetical protein